MNNIQTAQHTGSYRGKVPNGQWHYGAVFNWVLKVIHVFLGFWNTALSDWLKRTRPTLSANQKSNQNQSCLARTHFPAFRLGHMYWLPVLIGSLDCSCPLWLASDYFAFPFTKRNSKSYWSHRVFQNRFNHLYKRKRSRSSPSIQWLQPGLALADGGVSSALFGDFFTCLGLPGASTSHCLLTI